MSKLTQEEQAELVKFLVEDELNDAVLSEPTWNEDEDWMDDEDEVNDWGGCCLCGGDHFEDACPVYPEPFSSLICGVP